MTYDPNGLSRFDGILDGRWNYWVYRSADTYTAVKAPNYFVDAQARGVKPRDLLVVLDTVSPATTIANFMTVGATGATISQGGVTVADVAGGGTGGGTGTLTSVTVGIGLTATPDPITTVGSVALQTPVSIANGGTGATAAPAALAALGGAPLASPVLTGDPRSPTPATADNDTSVATTAFVKAQGYGVGSLTGVTAGTGLTGGGTSGNPTVALQTPVSIANGGTGAATASAALANLGGAPASGFPVTWTAGSIAFAASTASLGQDNANLFWDDANNRLGIGTASPGQPLDVNGNARLAGDLYVGGGVNPALRSSPPASNWYTIVYAPDGTGTGRGIYVGSVGVGGHNYYRNDDHQLQNADGSVAYLTAAATGVTANLALFAPTAAAATNSTQVATTAYVKSQNYLTANQTITLSGDISGSGTGAITTTLPNVNANVGTFQGIVVNAKGQVTGAVNQNYAPLASPVFTGDARAVTPATADNDTSVATTAYVQAQGYATSAAMTTADNLRVLKAGDTVTGNLIVNPGKLGVGPTAPTAQLHVSGPAAGIWAGTFNGSTTSGSSFGIFMTAGTTSADYALLIQNAAGASNLLLVKGDGACQNISGAWGVISARELKQDVAPYTRGLEAIAALNPVQFRYAAGTPFAPEDAPSRPLFGLMADQVRPHVPEIVGSTIGTVRGVEGVEIDTLEPGLLIFSLINAVKELSAKVAALEAAAKAA